MGVRRRQAGIEFERPSELMLSMGKVPVKSKRDIAERGMGFCQSVVEFNGSCSSGFGPGHHLKWSSRNRAQIGVGISQAGVSDRTLWVKGHSLLKISNGLLGGFGLQIFRGLSSRTVQLVKPAQIRLMGSWIDGPGT